VLRQACPQVFLELRPDPEVLEPLRILEQEVDAIRERGPGAQVGAAILADPLRFVRHAGARQRGLEARRVEADALRGARAHAAGSPQGVQQLVALAPREGSRQTVQVEQRRDVLLVHLGAIGAPPPRGERARDHRAAAAVLADEPLEHRSTVGAAQLVEQREEDGHRGRVGDAVAGAPDHDVGGAGARRALATGRCRANRVGRGGARHHGWLALVATGALALGGDVGRDPARKVGQGQGPERPRRRGIGEQRPHRQDLVPAERRERSLDLGRAGLSTGLRAPARHPLQQLRIQLRHGEREPCRGGLRSQG
jgi:hypothetical protein